jgi:hypothetical protein
MALAYGVAATVPVKLAGPAFLARKSRVRRVFGALRYGIVADAEGLSGPSRETAVMSGALQLTSASPLDRNFRQS